MAGKGSFSDIIIQWYRENKRDLPWRHSRDPYKIWLSEIILQQTRVAQGLPYYYKFVDQFPTVNDLADADTSTVLRTWQGLGYYSRARNLHKCAKTIAQEYNGRFPEEYAELITLPGIGPYTAAAIASFAFDKPEAVVDGNVFRVLSRFFGLDDDIASGKGMRVFRDYAKEILPESHISDYNQGIMEFGATQCKPGGPDCDICPLSLDCFARKNSKQLELPVKSKKTKTSVVTFNYLVILFEGKVWMKERGKGIWQGLYDFYLEEGEWKEPEKSIRKIIKQEFELLSVNERTHILSHRQILANFYTIELVENTQLKANGGFFAMNEVEKLPKPILIDWFFKDVMKSLVE